MAHDAFISYSSKDKPVADAVCAGLESRGVRCWIAPRDILPGADWGAAIIDAISASKVMVLIYSSGANASPQITREVERAVAKGVKLVPFRIEDVPMSKNLEYFISTPHWLDALTEPLEQHVARLAETVSFLANARDSTQVPPPLKRTPPAPTARSAPRTASRVPLGVAVIAAAAAAAAFLLLRGGSPEIKDVKFPATIPAGSRDVSGTVFFKPGRDAITDATFSVVSADRFEPFTVHPRADEQTRGFFSFPIHSTVPQQVTMTVTLVDAKNRRSNSYPLAFEVKKMSAAARDKSFEVQTPQGFKFKIPRSN